MNPLRRRLGSRVAAAGLLALVLAACDKAPAPPPRAAARPSAAPAAPPPRPGLAVASPAALHASPAVASAPGAEELADLAERDPRAALLAAASSGDSGPAASHLRGGFLARWAAFDFTAAYAYADRLPAGAEREEMLGRLALVMVEWIPSEAAAIVARDMAPGEARTEAAVSVVHRWASADPAGARAWTSAFSPGPLRERALREVAGAAPRGAP